MELDEQVTSLKDQIRSYEEEINQFEALQADWLSEKETLEGVLVELRSQLKEKENVLHTLEAEKVLHGNRTVFARLTMCNIACICQVLVHRYC